MENVLLTGGCGLLGRTLAPLLAAKYSVTHFEVSDPGDGLPWIQGDLRDGATVAKACCGMDAVVHVAALHGRSWADAGDDVGFQVNVVGTKNLLEGSVAAGVGRVVFTSSIWATGHDRPPAPYLPIDEDLPRQPAELYGLSKVLGEEMCRYATANHGTSTIILRPGGIRPADDFRPFDPALLFGAVDVRDVAQAHMLALQAREDLRHNVFVITADSPMCRVDLSAYQHDPARTLDALIPGVGQLVEDASVVLPARAEWYTIEKAQALLGYEPTFNFDLT